jgi:hypothetical protein
MVEPTRISTAMVPLPHEVRLTEFAALHSASAPSALARLRAAMDPKRSFRGAAR